MIYKASRIYEVIIAHQVHLTEQQKRALWACGIALLFEGQKAYIPAAASTKEVLQVNQKASSKAPASAQPTKYKKRKIDKDQRRRRNGKMSA